VACSYPATVQGNVETGEKFKARAVLANMSASGVYLYMRRPVHHGEILSISVRLSTAPLDKTAVRLSALGAVVRVEPKPDGTFGVAIKLHQHRFL
jgi:hypothetical protein